MVHKNKFWTMLAIILITGGFFVLSQSVYAEDCDNDPCELDCYVGTACLTDYMCCLHHSHVYVSDLSVVKFLACLGIDLNGKRYQDPNLNVNVDIKRPVLGGAYTLYFIMDTGEYFYTNDFIIKAMLKDKCIPRIEGYKIKPAN